MCDKSHVGEQLRSGPYGPSLPRPAATKSAVGPGVLWRSRVQLLQRNGYSTLLQVRNCADRSLFHSSGVGPGNLRNAVSIAMLLECSHAYWIQVHLC
jgi:hypothetical protein